MMTVSLGRGPSDDEILRRLRSFAKRAAELSSKLAALVHECDHGPVREMLHGSPADLRRFRAGVRRGKAKRAGKGRKPRR